MKNFYFKSYFAFVFFALLICTSCSKDVLQDQHQTDAIHQEILQLINTHRASIGKASLQTNVLATQLAEEHTQYMIAQNKLTHENSGVRAQKLYNEEHVVSVAENVANKYKTAQEAMDAWLNSAPHRKNIEAGFTHTGISAIKNDVGIYYYTQIFLTKK